MTRRRTSLLAIALFAVFPAMGTESLLAQGEIGTQGAIALALEMRQLDGVKRVLMIGAHPDDEDTSLLAELARGHGVQTAYLSLTRGEGGQNLIGPELGEGLGIVRTGELLSARRVDGGSQIFTRAFDYGYSKTAEEALSLWPEDELLGDVVWAVRTFRPHVIVSVFSGTPADGHGQHQAAGIMARRVFDAAADPDLYPEQLSKGVGTWQASKLYRNAWRDPEAATTSIQTGTYDPLLGRSHFQIAMESRSQHRSQDMGAAQGLGPRQSNIELVRAFPAPNGSGDGLAALQTLGAEGFFAGVDTAIVSLAPAGQRGRAARESLEGYRRAIAAARARLDPFTPSASFEPLVAAVERLESALLAMPAGEDAHRTLIERRDRVAAAAILASGVIWDVRASDDLVVPGQVFRIDVEVWNGNSDAESSMLSLTGAEVSLALPPGTEVTETEPPPVPGRFGFGRSQQAPAGPASDAVWTPELKVVLTELPFGAFIRRSFFVRSAANVAPTRLYYLGQPRDGARYRWPADHTNWGMPRDADPFQAGLTLTAGGQSVAMTRPLRYRGVDPARGEFSSPVQIVPSVSVAMDPGVLVWPEGSSDPRAVQVTLRSAADTEQTGFLSLEVPSGFRTEPQSLPFTLEGAGSEATFSFELLSSGVPPRGAHEVRAVATVGGHDYAERLDLVDYEHIPRTPLYFPSTTQVSVFPVQVAEDLRLGYVMGSGDAVPDAIRQLGIEPTLLSEADLATGNLGAFDVVVLGVRAYATRPDLRRYNDRVLQFARDGGTLVVQYNQYSFPQGNYAPYPVDISRPHDRVSVEDAPVTMLDPEHPLTSVPNTITERDFEGWVQERGLYFLSDFDDRYTPILEMNDPGEDPKRGSLVVAPLGRGTYVYTGLSFFRQLPAGVPGAYRLFANIISLKNPGVS